MGFINKVGLHYLNCPLLHNMTGRILYITTVCSHMYPVLCMLFIVWSLSFLIFAGPYPSPGCAGVVALSCFRRRRNTLWPGTYNFHIYRIQRCPPQWWIQWNSVATVMNKQTFFIHQTIKLHEDVLNCLIGSNSFHYVKYVISFRHIFATSCHYGFWIWLV